MFGSHNVAPMTEALTARLPVPTTCDTQLVMENDLAGRAALAILWRYRSQLTVHLVTNNPQERNIRAMQSGISSVREAPEVRLISFDDAAVLPSHKTNVVWALAADRTAAATREALAARSADTTFAPYLEVFSALDEQYPDQTIARHELLLRDIIGNHASFLNFFGDRFNPNDLYERSKYPVWIDPPEGFVAGLPRLAQVTTAADGTLIEAADFDGDLALDSENILEGVRVVVELGPILEVLDGQPHDLVITLANAYFNPNGGGALAIQVHRDDKIVSSVDVATSDAREQIKLTGLTTGTRVGVSVVVLKDNPKRSWAKATQTALHLTITAASQHPKWPHRAKAWLQRLAPPRQPANSSRGTT